jgi:hypothetical protein
MVTTWSLILSHLVFPYFLKFQSIQVLVQDHLLLKLLYLTYTIESMDNNWVWLT